MQHGKLALSTVLTLIPMKWKQKPMTKILQAQGAYMRQANLADWNAGKDFKIVYGPYFSIRDLAALKKDGYTAISFVCARFGGVLFTVEIK
jgi:hypothetical protein